MDPEEHMPENAKEMINNLLWMILPPHATLEQAEDIALDIYRKVVDAWAGMAMDTGTDDGSADYGARTRGHHQSS